MEEKIKKEAQVELMYGVEDKPKLISRILLAFQHIFAAFGGIIVVPIIVASSLKLNAETSTALLSAAILMAGVATFIQSKGVYSVGARVACIMGTDITFVAPAAVVGKKFGLAGIFGATILGAIIVVILSFFIKHIMKLFPKVVTGIVVCLIGLTLLPVSIDWAAGGSGAKNYGSLQNITIALIVMIVTLLINHYGKGLVSSASILIGMVVGYIICIPLGMVDFSTIAGLKIISVPAVFQYGVKFNLSALLPFIPAYFVSVISTVGNLRAINEISDIDDDTRISKGVLSDGIGSILAGMFGAMPNTSFSQNVGLIPLTKVASRYVTLVAGIILIILGLVPKFSGVINVMPQPVLGGVGIVMFGTVAAAGIQTLSHVNLNNRNILIIATSIGLGLGVTFRPEILSGLPESLKMIFSSGISTGTIAALILNLVLKEK
ncbi:uracil-xanthine permease family protein [Clostridium felsineum]|uniref:Nucleobase transporter PlUacP n=1 Tax=Clostridium felsineum TaxID=36839 RepID=A0A1S8MFK1_9CLOT|nr:nucleobase:cation symporter-2 family protein [Clostridium felsineum]URZ05669.1 Nucleobase transporter PlUacP [Clostridium felsineum]URZ10708.1 Nucleobase transporter PlUacP [Clostridium felsineum]